MYRLACIILTAILSIGCLAGCGGGAETDAKTASTTLMIYMIGSDLEAKSGAATKDLQEIAESGVDTDHNKVVVCAGGAPRWHTEQVSAEKINLLELQGQNFVPVEVQEQESMGTAQPLARFLNYCWEHYPNDEFALILWDHGNGPVMGYGKDLVHNNDALLLKEMQDALDLSPFSADNKLSWIGFDACLMASAELSCLTSNYAKYLIASQEIEPAFGWDYRFLQRLGYAQPLDLLDAATESYMAACDAYYKKRNTENYDVTISVVDLALASQLESAIDQLFTRAAEEVPNYYDLLAMNRLNSYALGRATTGSDYDLVDLKDMTAQLSAQYPRLAQALSATIDRMVKVNKTSLGNCCGMSLYYPFYNKHYYEKDWKQIYTELGLFPAYQTYLTAYEKIWLQEDKLDLVSPGVTPEETGKNTYSVTLDEAQARAFGSAKFYVLQRSQNDIYTRVYSSSAVSWKDKTLTANYDGMAIYVSETNGQRFITSLSAVDQIGRLSRYSGIFQLSNMGYQPSDLTDDQLPEETLSNWRYLLTFNQETGHIEISGSAPYGEVGAEELAEYGRILEADLSQYGVINFLFDPPRYITRYDSGVLKPFEQWHSLGALTGYNVIVANGFSFDYAPLDGGEYYLMFEITDTQSTTYCTELLPIQIELTENEGTPLPVTESVWKAGEEKVLIREQDGIRLYLTAKETDLYPRPVRYFLVAENTNAYALSLDARATLNETIVTNSGCFFDVAANSTAEKELSLGLAEYNALSTLELEILIRNERSGATVWPTQICRIGMQDAPAVDKDTIDANYTAPYKSAFAQKQVICEKEGVRFTLMGVGTRGASSDMGQLYVHAENVSDKDLNISISGYAINGYFIPATAGETWLPAGKQCYLGVSFGEDKLEPFAIDQIQSLTVLATVSESRNGHFKEKKLLWRPVNLAQHGRKQTDSLGQLLWEEQGVRVYLRNTAKENKWEITIENQSDRAVSLGVVDALFDGVSKKHTFFCSDSALGAGQKTIGTICLYPTDNEPIPQTIEFHFQIRSFDGTCVFFTSDKTTTIYNQ